MIGDLYDADNVIVGQAAVLFALKGTPMITPAQFDVTDPFDLSVWTAGNSGWTPCGATDQGWQYGTNKSTQSITIEEQSTPVGTTITSQSVTISGSLSEDVSQTLALAYNAVLDANAPSNTSPGYDEITLSDDVVEYAVAMVTTNPEGFGRIIYAPAWTQLSNVSTSFRRAADKRMYPVEFATVCQTSDIVVVNFTAAKTS